MPPASGGILSDANAEINLVVIMLQIYNTGCRKSGYTPYSLMLFKKKPYIFTNTGELNNMQRSLTNSQKVKSKCIFKSH